MGQGQDGDSQQGEDIDLDLDDTGTADTDQDDNTSPGDDTAGAGDTGAGQADGQDAKASKQRPHVPRPKPPTERLGEWVPPDRDRWRKTLQQLRVATREAAERRAKLEEIELANASEAERREAKIASEAAAKAEGEWKPKLISAEARAALAAAGCHDVPRMVRLVDTGDLTIEADGTVAGLDEQVQALKEDYPDSFRVKRAPSGAPQPKPADDGVVNPGPGRAPAKKLSASERQAAALTGRRPTAR